MTSRSASRRKEILRDRVSEKWRERKCGKGRKGSLEKDGANIAHPCLFAQIVHFQVKGSCSQLLNF